MPFKKGVKVAGSGRKKGATTLKTRQIADQAFREGISPLEVMLKNMRFADQAADNAAALLPSLPTAQERLVAMNEVRHNKQRAQEAAKDAAPYMHSRLTSIDVGSDAKKPLRMVISWEGEDEHSEAVQSGEAEPAKGG